jgi:serine/threonine-protein kinase
MTDLLDRLKTALADRYAIERELGRGGMAVVYLANDSKLGRPVALKVLRPEFAASLGAERFLREIEIAAKLTHPNILALHDCGEAEGQLYYTMPFVEGESLRDRLNREKQLPIDDALQITKEVADALGYAHSLGIVHRDIKPENILFTAGHAVVSDFGIARAVTEAAGETLTETGLAVGTPAYMSPEQAAGSKGIDARTDIYSLGCVLYEMFVGEPPYTGPSAQVILARKSVEAVPSLSVARETVPDQVEHAVTKALAKVPADRFATAAQFSDALHGVSLAPAPPRRRRITVAVVTTLFIAAAAVLSLLAVKRERSADLDPNAIAVLPFRVVGGSPAVGALAGAIPELFHTQVTGEFGPCASYPPTVIHAWQRAGGGLGEPLEAVAELELARAVGAGLLVSGSVIGTDTSIIITATMRNVASGDIRVPPTKVEGQYERRFALVDQLVVQLLSRDFGEATEHLQEFARHPSEAVQAYLAGRKHWQDFDWVAAEAKFGEALRYDSTFVLAALYKFAATESDTAAARLAWEGQDRLTPTDRVYLHAIAGRLFGVTRTRREEIAGLEEAVRLGPNRTDLLTALGVRYANLGTFVVPDWIGRARHALERAVAQDSANALALLLLLELAVFERDTARVGRLADVYWDIGAGTKWEPYARWLVAEALGDTAEARRRWARLGPRGVYNYMLASSSFGLGVDRLARQHLAVTYVGSMMEFRGKTLWARYRGWYDEWRTYRESYFNASAPVTAAAFRIRDALFFGEWNEAVPAAVRVFTIIADGDSSPPPPSHVSGVAHCWSALWRLDRGDTDAAHAAIGYLRHEARFPERYTVCAALLDALLARAEGRDPQAAVLRLDSLAREGPQDLYLGWWLTEHDHMSGLRNLLDVRLLLEIGDTTRALEATRRGQGGGAWRSVWTEGYLLDLLREEGRLAAAVGDTAAATRAYQHYLTLREDPDPPWREEWQQVRAEVAALVGEPRR